MSLDLEDLQNLPYTVLGLDLSLTSTGIACLEEGQFFTSVLSVSDKAKESEAAARYQLKTELAETFEGMSFDAIIVEDVFFGQNPKTYRQLLSLNTVVDELVLEGVFSGPILRVSNTKWKSWLSPLLPGVKRGYWKDKVFIRRALETLGISFQGPGAQDQYDALGMVIGWLLETETDQETGIIGTSGDSFTGESNKVLWKDISWSYTEDRLPKSDLVHLRTINKPEILKLANTKEARRGKLFCVPARSLGLLGAQINAPVLPEGGYFHFSLSEGLLDA